ncbi:ArsR family transcriptional regulator [Fictibacillus macauensis ZFHKF-1]|uniref:ArsR family transcriptional regulator n=1 Tax=Fictibacillus macauensis ZFHKF-1 TaxID=1196324 RepID=I8UKL0_9BACL|nr:winged helix-turn-helix domain-containing protein [Fictibacillus macauensis]EIT87368.1 ArsR family transcriptional regulator [Fictibacillus macauensis ZFHKF-1]
MKIIHSPLPQETIRLSVESSPVWEMILGIAAFTHHQLRHTFEFHEKWNEQAPTMSATLTSHLQDIQQTNLWYGMLLLQNKVSATSVPDFSNKISALSQQELYETLLPYKDRSLEKLRKETVRDAQSFISFSAHFRGHDYLEGYIVTLSQKKPHEIIQLCSETLSEWYAWIQQTENWEKWMQALAFEKKAYSSIDVMKPTEEIKRITGGVNYLPEPSIWQIKLVPHVSYRPWVLEQRTCDTKLLFYPLHDEALVAPGTPPQALVRGHKALGDELRLKLLHQMMQGPLSLGELSVQFNVSKTTLHHQLSLLKAAKFIGVDKGIYFANATEIQAFSTKLSHYLHASEPS